MEFPRDSLLRAVPKGDYLVRESADDGSPTLVGHFARFNEWTEINSLWEGRFMERIAPGAFEESFARYTPKVLFQHGQDPSVGDQVLGRAETLREDADGAYYEVPLYDGIPPLVMAGLRDGAYGASFRFSVNSEEIENKPERSEYNPEGLPERTITGAEVMEFGPVTFPAYAGATAGVRSLTDWYRTDFDSQLSELATQRPTELAQRIERALTLANTPGADKPKEDEPAAAEAEGGAPQAEAQPQETQEEAMAIDLDRFDKPELLTQKRKELVERMQYLEAEHAGKGFPADVEAEFDEAAEDIDKIDARLAELAKRAARLERIAGNGHTEPADGATGRTRIEPFNVGGDAGRKVEDPYDMTAYRKAASTPQQEARLLRDGLKRSVETTTFPESKRLSREDAQAAVVALVDKIEGSDEDVQDETGRNGRLAGYFLAVGAPSYRRAFAKFALAAPATAMLGPEESRAIQTAKGWEERAFSLGSTGLPVPYQLDPTVLPISNFSVNPFRAVGRVVQTTVNEWRGATSAGITAAYAAEATEASDNTPTLAQPTISAVRAQAFVPFSIEVDQDWSTLESEMLSEVADAKDDLEATKFTLGSGTNEPFGLITGATTLVSTTSTGAFVIADLYKMEEALPPRFRPRAAILGNRFVFNKVRQFDTSGGSGVWLDGLQPGLANQVPTPGAIGPRILGYPAFEDTAMDAALTTGSEILVMGQYDPYFTIVDRVGMSADLIPHLVGTNHRPTGQRGLYFFWRNGSKVINAAAFRTLQT